MEGLILRFNGRTRNIIRELLNGVDILELEFDISHWESFGDDLDGSEFDFNNIEKIPSDLIKNKVFIEDHLVHPEFMEFYIRKNGTKSKKIYFYKDFLESDYLVSIINCDYRNVEIFSKDEAILERVKNNFSTLDLDNKRIRELDNISLNAVLQAWEFGKGIEK